MIELPYSVVIGATEEPDYFGFYSPDPRVIIPNAKDPMVAAWQEMACRTGINPARSGPITVASPEPLDIPTRPAAGRRP